MSCKTSQERWADTNLKVNGKKIELNNFVQSFISKTIIGMVESLRGAGSIKTVELKVSRKRKDS